MKDCEKYWEKNPRIDLALEARELVSEDEEEEIPGVKLTVEEDEEFEITISRIEVLNEEGEKNVNKPIGNYITIESPILKENDIEVHDEIITIMSEEIKKITNLNTDSKIMIVGLGNRDVTPDALGPKVVSKLLVTRHLFQYVPDQLDDSISSVSALAPGVMGQTGIETGEIIQGVVENTKPDLIIAIDALASRKTSRVNTTIQISDTGVNPGSGVGNHRMGLTEEALGVPVVAIGVPTVVDAPTIVSDTIDFLIEAIEKEKPGGVGAAGVLKDFSEEEKYALVKEVLTPNVGALFVTPKDVDAVIERLGNIIANALNLAVHQGLDREDIDRYVY